MAAGPSDAAVHVGHVISGAGHLGLIGWLLLGGVFKSEPLPFEATEVSVISGAEFEAMLASDESPQEITQAVQTPAPEAIPEAPQVQPVEETPVETPAPSPVPQAPAAPDEVPEPPEPLPQAEVSDAAPLSPEPPAEVAVLVPNISQRPVARPAPRIAPEPVAQPEPEVRPDPVETPAVAPEETGETVEEPQEATAPEEATTEVVTEAEETPAAAPTQSVRPPARRPAPPARQTAEAEAPSGETEPDSSDDDAVSAAVQEALSGTESDTPAAPSGPPLTSGEKENLRVAVSACWNVAALSSEALATTVTVAVSMEQSGKPVAASIRMLGSEGGSSASAKQAFEAARRAIIRCGAKGYQLPVEKFGQWQDIEMTFNPERMRVK